MLVLRFAPDAGAPNPSEISWGWCREDEGVEPSRCSELWSAEPGAAFLLTLSSDEINGIK